MVCCGQKRSQLLTRSSAGRQSADTTPVYFQYIGGKSLTVIGRETRRHYQFDRPGAVVAIDKRDQRSLEALPTLRLMREAP